MRPRFGGHHRKEIKNESIITFHIEQSGYRGVSFSHLKIMSNLAGKQLDTLLQHLLSRRIILQIDKENRLYIHQTTFDQLNQKSAEYLAKYHETNPLKAGMPKEELRSKFPRLANSKLFNQLLNQMIKSKQIVQEENTVRLENHRVSLGQDQADIRKKSLKSIKPVGCSRRIFATSSSSWMLSPNMSRMC